MDTNDPGFDVADYINDVNEAAPEPSDNPPPLPDSVAHLAGEHETDESVSQAVNEPTVSNFSTDNGLRDVDGNSFNPDLHKVSEDGTPVLNKNGTLRKKGGRGAAKAKQNARQADPSVSQFNPGTGSRSENSARDPEAEKLAQAETVMRTETSKSLAQLTELSGVLIGGEDFVASEQERQNLAGTYDAYMQARGINPAMSPEAVLIAGISAYVIPRFGKPEPKKRLKFGWLWIRDKFSNMTKRVKLGGIIKRAKKSDEQEPAPRMEDLQPGAKDARAYRWPLDS